MSITKRELDSDCDCYERSRFDPDGNLVLLFTCSACLNEACEYLREYVGNSPEGVVQLELFTGSGADGKTVPSCFPKGRSV